MIVARKHLIALLVGCSPFIAFAQSNEEESVKAFVAAVKVMQHPRCTNCHAKGNGPRQTDASREHMFNVKRGPEDRGVGGYTCADSTGGCNTLEPE